MGKSDLAVENYLKAIENFIDLGGSKKFWSFAPGQVDSYFIDIFSINLFEKFLSNPTRFKNAISTLETNILRWFALPYVILGLKLANNNENYHATSTEMVNYIQEVKEILGKKVLSDPFCLDGQNKKMSDQEVANKFSKIHLFNAKDKKVINIFSSVLQSYLWSIEFDAFTYGASWHGPYIVDSKIILCKTYYDLNSLVWNIQDLPDRVEIFYLFEGDIDWKVDLMELAEFQPDLWDKLDSIGLVMDGEVVDNLKVIENLTEKFSKIRDKQVAFIDDLPPQKIIMKGAEVYYFMFKSFFDAYQESFQPPQVVDQRIEDEGLKYWNAFKQVPNKDLMPGKDYFRKLYDPRNNFTG